MNQIEKAIAWESKKMVRRAFSIYKDILQEEECPRLEVILNVIVLCFDMQDPASYQLYDIDLAFEETCWSFLKDLLPKARSLYPNSIELEFWENYVFFRYWGDHPYEEINPKFSEQHETLVPYFFYYDPETGAFEKEASELWEQVKEGKTCRERYIMELLGNQPPSSTRKVK